MEEHKEQIESLMRSHGFEEKEAEAAYYLRRARETLDELEKDDEESAPTGGFRGMYTHVYETTHVYSHFRALNNVLARRVLSRHYPEGWGGGPQEEAEVEER